MFFSDSKTRQNEKELATAQAKIRRIVASHIQTLARRRIQTIRIDSYGVVDMTAWNKEVQHFVDKVIRPHLTSAEAQAVAISGFSEIMTQLVERPAQEECKRIEDATHYNDSISPIEYERFCASLLSNAGWLCTLTKASGDQGADITASKNGRMLVVQCKKYGSSVGNSAVQEAIAAKNFNKAHYAAVVTNANFTKSAKELAAVCDILLLNHTDLSNINSLIS